jgi:acyl-CoA synthetase
MAISGPAAAGDVIEHLIGEGLSPYEAPEYFLRLEAFPLTASGKILKRELVGLVQQGRLRPEPIQRPAKKGTS